MNKDGARLRPSMLRTTRIVSFVALLLVVAGIAVLSVMVMRSFLLPLFMAALLVVIFEPVHQWILSRCRGRKLMAAAITTSVILLVVLAPIGWAISVGVEEAIQLASDTDPGNFLDQFENLRSSVGLQMPFGEQLERLDLGLQTLTIDPNDADAASELSRHSRPLTGLLEEIAQLETQLERYTRPQPNPGDPQGTPVPPSHSLVQRIDEARPFLNSMQERLVQAQAAIDAVSGDAQDANRVRDYVDRVREAGDAYRSMRIALLGGVLWAPVTELANPGEERIRGWKTNLMETLRNWMLRLTGQTTSLMGSMLMQLFVLSIALYYFLLDGEQMVHGAIELSPMEDAYEHEMVAEFAKLSRAVVLATLLSAIAQGLLAGMGYFAVWQFQSLFVLIILTTLLSMVPFVGAAAVWVPVCLYLAFVEQRYVAATLLGIWGFGVVSMADNIIKPWVLKGQSNLHPLFALLSVLGGVKVLGPVGVLVGPMVVAFMQSLLNILHRALKQMDEDRSHDPAAS